MKSIKMEKMSRWENFESRLHLQGIMFLHQPALLKEIGKVQFLGFMKLKFKI